MYNMRGPNIAVVTACTTGTHNIGLAARMIEYGDADVMIAGVLKWRQPGWVSVVSQRCVHCLREMMSQKKQVVLGIKTVMDLSWVMARCLGA